MRGSSELFSQILSNEGILQRWTSGHTFFEAGGPMGFKATLDKLEGYHGKRAVEPIKRLFKGFEGMGAPYPQVGVGKETGSLALRLAGHRVEVPVQTQVRGVYQMGASKYSAANVLTRTGSVSEKLDLTSYFHRAVMGSPGVRGITEVPGIVTGFPQLQTSDPSMMAKYMSDLSSQMRQSKMKALMTKSGVPDFSRAYFDAHRVELPVTERMGMLLGEMQRVSKRFSMRGYDPTDSGPITDILKGKDTVVEFGKGKGLHEYQQRLLGEYYKEVGGVYPGYNWAAIKEGGVLPFIKDQKAASKTATHVIMSDLHPDATLKFSAMGPEGKGWQDMVKVHLLASGDISRRHLGRMTPTLVERDMVGRLEWMSGVRGRSAAELSTAVPMTVGHIDPGASVEARRFISEYLGDSGALALSKPGRELAGYGSRFRKVDVPLARFETVPELMSQLEALGPAGEGTIFGPGRTRGLSGADIKQRWLRRLTKREPAVGPQTIAQTIDARKARAVARRVQREPGGFLGALKVPYVGEEVIPLGTDERIVGAQMIDQGTKARLFVDTGEPTKFVGGGLDIGARRMSVVGGGPELMMMGGRILDRQTGLKMTLAELRQAARGDLSAIDLLMPGNEMGSKLVGAGADVRMQTDVYLSHVFGELQASGIRKPQRRAAIQSLAEQMGLRTADVKYGYKGQRARTLVYGESNVLGDIVGPIIDVKVGRRAPVNVEGSTEALKQVRSALAKAQQRAGVMTPEEVGAFYRAFEVPRVPLAEIAKRIAPDLPQAALEEMTTKKAEVLLPKHQGVYARTLSGLEKQGASGMRYRMNELMLMERNAAFAPTPELKEAWGTLLDAFRPKAKTSAVGSEILRTFEPFMGVDLKPEKLLPTQTITREQLAQLGRIPEGQRTVRGNLLTSEALGGVGKPTLLHTLDPDGKILLRQTGLKLRLDEAIPVTIPRLGVKDAPLGPGARITEMQLPGMEILGKFDSKQWRREGEMFFEGTSRISRAEKAYDAKLFGDAEQLWRQAEEYARGGEVRPLQQAYQRYLTTLSQEIPGKESVLARAFRDESVLSFSGQLAQYRPQPGQAKPGPLTVAVSESWIKSTKEGRKFIDRFGKQGMGFMFEYPATEQAHQIPVQVDVVKDTFFGPKLYRGDGKGVIAGTETMRYLQQRDLDFDIGMLRLLTNPKHAKAAQVIHQYESKRFEAVQQMIEQVDWDNPKRQEEILRGYSREAIDDLPGSTANEIKKLMKSKAGPMENIIRQKMQTPLAHTTIRKQGAVMEMLSRDPDAVKRALGGAVDTSIDQFLSQANQRGYANMYGELATVSQYAVLEKAAGKGSALEQFSAYWTQTPAFVEKGRGAKAEVGELTKYIESMYTMEGQLPEVLAGTEKGNKAGAAILRGWTNDNFVADMRSRDYASAASKARKEYFEPMAEAMADLQMYSGRLAGRGGRQPSHLSTMFGPFFGQTGTLEYERLGDVQGALSQYLRWSDAGADAAKFPHFLRTPEAQAAALEASQDPAMRATIADALEAINATSAGPGQSGTAESLARTGRNIVKEIWNTKAGKISMVGAGALLGYGMLKGLVGDDEPQRTYPGGGAPMPPKPLLDTAAHQFQQVPTQIPRSAARVARPDAMQTSSTGSVVARPDPAMMTVGYSSVGPGYAKTPRAEHDLPEVTNWEMQNYLGHRMRSSW